MHKRLGRNHASRTRAERTENGWAMFMTLLLLLPATAFAMWGTLWIATWLYVLSLWPWTGLDFRRR